MGCRPDGAGDDIRRLFLPMCRPDGACLKVSDFIHRCVAPMGLGMIYAGCVSTDVSPRWGLELYTPVVYLPMYRSHGAIYDIDCCRWAFMENHRKHSLFQPLIQRFDQSHQLPIMVVHDLAFVVEYHGRAVF